MKFVVLPFFLLVVSIASASQPAVKLFQFDIAPISVTMAGNIINGFYENITAAMYEQPELNSDLGLLEKKTPNWFMMPTYMFVEKRAYSGDQYWVSDRELYVAYVPVANSDNIYERSGIILTTIDNKEYIVDMIKLLVDETGAVYYGGYIPGAPVTENQEVNPLFALIPIAIFIVGLVLIIKHKRSKTSGAPSFFNPA